MTAAAAHVPARTEGRRELLLVALLTAVGGILRLWAPQRLGLIHFDEGIYALAGLWPFSKGGLGAIDPTVIAYAPGGFPCLVGLSYLILGVSDLAAILVSVVAGTLTIPLAAWLARRTFGVGAGAAAAALVALSGGHVAFSRMALVDASFLLFWTLGMISAQRFLENPGLLTALALGASTGLAQLFKYNGWLIGAVVILTALLGLVLDANERSRSRLAAIWGYGLLAALLAATVYWPWFRFVDSHGGYSRLLAHHRSYLVGPGSWLTHLRQQLEQMAVLTGGPAWTVAASVASVSGFALVAGRMTPAGTRRWILAGVLLLVIAALIQVSWFIVGIWFLPALIVGGARDRVLIVAWLGLVLLTPFYRPYARLWLPVQLFGWIMLAGFVRSCLLQDQGPYADVVRSPDGSYRPFRWPVIALRVSGLCLALLPMPRNVFLSGRAQHPPVLSPSNSLKQAVRLALVDLPERSQGLRLLARPPVTFYLGGQVAARVEPNLAALLEGGNPGLWSLVDLAMLRQEGDVNYAREKLLARWELVREYPTELNLPTLLDVDPSAALTGRSPAVECPLLLLRPRGQGPSS